MGQIPLDQEGQIQEGYLGVCEAALAALAALMLLDCRSLDPSCLL